MMSNLLHINLSKCFFMYFKPNIYSRNTCIRLEPYNANHKIILNGQKIKQVSTIKFLGVTIDENLTWLPHIEILRKKLLMCHGTLNRIRTSIPKRLYKTVYHALFESHLTYGITVWGAQSQSVLQNLFNVQKKCIRMLFGGKISNTNKFCYCNYGESGTMIYCQKCKNWFHDECLGLTETEMSNIINFYCAQCLESNHNLTINYKVPLPQTTKPTFCHCNGSEIGIMIECNKCKEWFHDGCIDFSEQEIKQILLYFCKNCIETDSNGSLKIVYKDYTDEHTKPLFNSHKILTVHNLYIYHTLLELYKILKFRNPYCLFEIFSRTGIVRQMDLNIQAPPVSLQCQRVSFTYQSCIFWNKFYKKLVIPFSIPLHQSYILKHNLTNSESIHYDYSTTVNIFKSNLSKLLFQTQSIGNADSWVVVNHMSIA